MLELFSNDNGKSQAEILVLFDFFAFKLEMSGQNLKLETGFNEKDFIYRKRVPKSL